MILAEERESWRRRGRKETETERSENGNELSDLGEREKGRLKGKSSSK